MSKKTIDTFISYDILHIEINPSPSIGVFGKGAG